MTPVIYVKICVRRCDAIKSMGSCSCQEIILSTDNNRKNFTSGEVRQTITSSTNYRGRFQDKCQPSKNVSISQLLFPGIPKPREIMNILTVSLHQIYNLSRKTKGDI
jgi:hypothetical protein